LATNKIFSKKNTYPILILLGKRKKIQRKNKFIHLEKQRVILSYQKKYNYSTFIETGTYEGDMIDALKNNFKSLFSIELGEKLYEKAVNRFKNNSNIKILQGDSAEVLKQILPTIKTPTIFWLDAHYSQGETAKGSIDTPIEQELNTILSHSIKNNVILIDDARLFNGENDYPEINSLKNNILNTYPSITFEVTDDIIRIF